MSKSEHENFTQIVRNLITENKRRLLIELKESKELVKLIGQSTMRPLTEQEETKVKQQLLDIFKSIPSLAIFMLPGGALLLPLVLKFIPKLLPSAFSDDTNLEEE